MRTTGRGANALAYGVSVLALTSAGLHGAKAQTVLDTITVVATLTEENVWNTLAPVSVVRQEQLNQLMPSRPSDAFFGMPGISFEQTARDPATAINIRGMQDFGRVAVTIDGARQNFTRLGHDGAGTFYLEPELLAGIDVVRGPTANIYGSGAIGGVVSFRTKDVMDVVRPGEKWGVQAHGFGNANGPEGLASIFAGARVNPSVDIFVGATHRDRGNYTTGRNGTLPVPMPAAAGVAPGKEIPNSSAEISTAIAKATFRSFDGHEVKFGVIGYEADWVNQNIPSQGTPTVRSSKLENNTATARWRYSKPEDRLFDFDANVYVNRVKMTQMNVAVDPLNVPFFGPVGNRTSYDLLTTGFDAHNTSRFETGPFRHALTLGADLFKDDVENTDPAGFGGGYNPNGKRQVYGGFAQLKTNYGSWLEIISALRYDNYELNGTNQTTGAPVSTSGDRVSPKITVGLTPMPWFTVYGSYAEGYRAPSVTETLVSERHPGSANFLFIPNPELKPEIGKNKELGFNIRQDNLFVSGDKFRMKASIYQNDVDDFIESNTYCPAAPFLCFGMGGPNFLHWVSQYQNVAKARIKGAEFESNYDAGAWFAGLSGHRIRGTDLTEGDPLNKIPPDMIAGTLGMRFWENKVTASVRWAHYAAKNLEDLPVGSTPTANLTDTTRSYNLVSLYLGFQPTEDVIAGIVVDNLLDEYYIRYTDELPSPGLSVKASLKIRFGKMGS